MHAFVRKLMSKFLKPTVIKDTTVLEVEYEAEHNQLPDDKLSVGFTTRTTINRLLEGGDISQQEVKKFFKSVRYFFMKAVSYALQRLPLEEPVLKHATFVDWQKEMDVSAFDVLYFINRYKDLSPFSDPREQDKVEEEFSDYQMMSDDEIPPATCQEFISRVNEDQEFMQMDKLWAYLFTMKNPVTGRKRFLRLTKIALLVLCLPHSNADAERVFSAIGLNKTETRNALDLDGSLSSIMTIKMAADEPCYKYEPSKDVIQASRRATHSYNKEHRWP